MLVGSVRGWCSVGLSSLAALLLASSPIGPLAAAPARADIIDDNPFAVSRGPGDAQVFARGADGSIYVASRRGSGWTTWSSLGGSTTSGPGVALYGGTLQLLARGADGAVWMQSWPGGPPAPWMLLGGTPFSAPAVTPLRGSDLLYAFYRGQDDALWYRTYSPTKGWGSWASLGGEITSAPTAISRTNGIIDIFARGAKGAVVQISWVHDHWSEWSSLGGIASAAPVATTRGSSNVEVFHRGIHGTLYQKTWNGSGWSGWSQIDATVVDSGPAAVAEGSGQIDLFARIGDSVKVNQLAAGRWSGWSSLGPVQAPSCLGAETPSPSRTISATVPRQPGVRPGRRGRVAVVRFRHEAKLTGQLVNADGSPIAGAEVCVGRGQPGTRPTLVGSVLTEADGSFSYLLPAGPSRVVQFAHLDDDGSRVSARVRLNVRAKLQLGATPRRLRNGQTVKMTGRLVGRPHPRNGSLVEIQAWRPSRWQTFETVRTNRRGRFRASYRFTRTSGVQTYRIRAHLPRQGNYPYMPAASRPVSIRVSG